MKHKGFTLLELLIAVAVAGIMIFAVSSVINTSDEDSMIYFAPEIENARSQRRMADELARQNDLMQRRIELLEQSSQNKQAESDQ